MTDIKASFTATQEKARAEGSRVLVTSAKEIEELVAEAIHKSRATQEILSSRRRLDSDELDSHLADDSAGREAGTPQGACK